MWKISQRLWINPLNITYAQDREVYLAPQRSEEKVPELALYFNDDAKCLALRGEERLALLAYLSQHTTPTPPYLVRDDSDEPPF